MALSRIIYTTMALILALIIGIGAWFSRGAYDDVMMNEGGDVADADERRHKHLKGWAHRNKGHGDARERA